MFTIRSVSTRKISRIGKQCFRGPDLFFFEIRSEPHKLEQAMPLAVKNAKNDRPARTAVSAFSLDEATSPYPFDRACVSGCAPKSALHANRHPLKFSERLLCESVKTQFVCFHFLPVSVDHLK